MAISVGDLQVRLSGGASNTDQMSSLGGAISTASAGLVISQTWTNPTNVTGVTIKNAMANAEGNGSLKYDVSTTTLSWKPYGGLQYDGVVISGNGIYTLGTSNGYLVVEVVAASLPGTTQTDNNITIANALNKTFDNISALESLNGDTEYRCFYLKNTHASQTAYSIKLWIKTNTNGPDDLSICLDDNGKNGTARGPLNDEGDSTNVLSGLSFTQPTSQGTGLTIGDLSAGDYYAFWIKRVIPAESTEQLTNDLSALGFSALI